MANTYEKIPRGGWYIDNTTLTFDENKVLSVVGGGDYLSLDGSTIVGYEEFTQQVTADSDQIVQATLTPTGP